MNRKRLMGGMIIGLIVGTLGAGAGWVQPMTPPLNRPGFLGGSNL